MADSLDQYDIFDRVWRVIIQGDGVKLDLYRDGEDILSGLRIEFTVVKSRGIDPNTCALKITGLSEDHRLMTIKRGTSIELYAGYKQDGARLLYRGHVMFGQLERSGADWVVSLESIDGFGGAPVATKFAKGSAQADVLDGLRQLMPGSDGKAGSVGKGAMMSQPTGTLQKSRVLVGTIGAAVRMVSEEQGLLTSVQDGAMQSTRPVEDTGEAPIDLGPDTGMEGSPARTKAGLGNMVFHSPGVTCSMRLRPDVKMGRRLRISSEIFGGTTDKPSTLDFIAIKVTHVGDSWGPAWTTQLEAFNV